MRNELADARTPARLTLFAYGFRPFFLLTGLWAVVPMAVLWWSVTTGHWAAGAGTPFAWHGHEMIFGFVAAAIAGFLLTAVPSWTGTRLDVGDDVFLGPPQATPSTSPPPSVTSPFGSSMMES